MLDAQGRFMVVDEVVAALVSATGWSLEAIFLAGYLLSLLLIWIGLLLIGDRVYRTRWLTVALAAAFTLRHRIARTSANSFEPYFHPRMLAFGVGLLALAALLRRRTWSAIALVAAAAAVHVTTGIWFAILIGVALVILDGHVRRLAWYTAGAAAIVVVWAGSTGRLIPLLAPMDAQWLQAVATKDSLFATTWPAWAWAANLGLLPLIWLAHSRRRRANDATPEDGALVWGATALVGVFLLTLPLVAAAATFPVQLQISRVFWLVDFVSLLYLLAALARRSPATARTLAIALLGVSALRGAYVMTVEQPDRPLVAVSVAASPWQEAMDWLARQPRDVHVLADPGHAWKYGTSVRVAAGRDVYLEEVKDSALAIYARHTAVRVNERTAALGDFTTLDAARARQLADSYGLDYLVTEADLPLPRVYGNTRFRIYALAPAVTARPAS